MTPNNFRVKSGLTVGTTISGGNTTITGFINVSGAANVSSLAVGGTVLNSTTFAGTANNASFLGGTAASGYQTTAGLSANVATLTSNNSTNLGGSSLAIIQGQITGNAATAYTNAIAIAANGSNITSGTVAFARLPSLFIGTTTIQSTSAAQAVSGITTLATGNTTITGFANVSTTLAVAGISTFSGNVVLGSVGVSANGGFGTAGHTLHSNGTATYWAADDNSGGTVTSVGSGNGLTGGAITTTGTLSVVANSGLIANTTGVFVNANTELTANSTGVFHNDIARSNTTTGNTSPNYGGTFTAVDSITTNARGHVTAVNTKTVTMPSSNNTTYDLVAVANTAVNAGLLRLSDSSLSNDTITFTGTGTSNVSSNATHIIINSADQFVGTVTSVGSGNGLTGGAITTTGTLSVVGGSTLTVNTLGVHVNSALSIASLALSGDLTVSGNLTVSGTRTYVNTTTLDVGDNIFTLNADLGAVAPSQDAGMEIMRGTSANVQFLWDETNDRWSTNGQPLAVSSLVAAGAASGITTLATGNTTITGFANVTSTIQGGSSLTIAGALSGVTTAAMGNTTITGFANVTSTLQVGGVATFAANANFDSGVLFVDGTNNRVGISTTAPQTKMQIFGSNAPETGDAASTETMLTLTRDGSASVWREGASFALGRWQTGGGSNPFSRLDINLKSVTDNSSLPNVTVMTLLDNGSVGIGNTAPTSRLVVGGGGGQVTTPTAIELDNTYSTTAGFDKLKLYLFKGGSETYGFGLGSNADVQYWAGSSSTGIHRFYTSQTERMQIAANGSVGIGTTSPAGRLSVSLGSATSSGSTSAWDNTYAVFGTTTSTGAAVGLGFNSSSGGVISSLAPNVAWQPMNYHASSHLFNNSGSEVMRINTSGNVGIGTTSVGARFEVYQSTGGTNSIRMNTNFASGNYVDLNPSISGVSNGGYSISLNGTIYQVISAAGNVGIGTTTPGYKLEVNGSFAATTKSFVIPHPTKPDMKLRYGSLEGPENGVYVRGRLKGGENIIQLPDYWEGLVDDDTYTVNLTPVGKHQELYVEHIASDHIVVGGENIDCFYTVFAERNDVEKLVVEF